MTNKIIKKDMQISIQIYKNQFYNDHQEINKSSKKQLYT